MPRKLTLNTRTTPIIIENLEETQLSSSLVITKPQEPNSQPRNDSPDEIPQNLQSETSSQCNSSFNRTVSHCSRLSRVTMDMAIYKGIFSNRDDHNVFSAIDEDVNCSQWFYKLESGDIEGPYNSFDMDLKFKEHVLTESTKIKRDIDEEYFTLNRLVRRYYSNVLVHRLNNTRRASNVSSKLMQFRKATIGSTKQPKPKILEIPGREERVVSALPRPRLVFLNNAINSSDDDEEPCPPRMRSQTLAN